MTATHKGDTMLRDGYLTSDLRAAGAAAAQLEAEGYDGAFTA